MMLSQCDCIAFELHSQCDKIKTLINDFELFENDGLKFWSNSVLKRIDTIIEKSGKARKSAEIRWKKGNIDANALHPHCAIDANAHQSKVKESKVNKIKVKESKIFIPPSFQEFSEYCISNGFTSIADRAFKGYKVANWHDAQGKPIHNWKQKLQNGWFREDNKNVRTNQIRSVNSNSNAKCTEGATAKSGEFDEGILTLDGVRTS